MSGTPKPTDTSDLSPFLADEEVEYARLLALVHAGGEAAMWEDVARRGVDGMKRLAASLAAATMRAEAAERALADIRQAPPFGRIQQEECAILSIRKDGFESSNRRNPTHPSTSDDIIARLRAQLAGDAAPDRVPCSRQLLLDAIAAIEEKTPAITEEEGAA